jgi:hypothetical protein
MSETEGRLPEAERPWYYNRAGEPVSLEEWAHLFEDVSYRRVAETTIGDVWVSTVFLGFDHQMFDGPPLIFETMIFGGNHDGEQWRYSTEAEALANHRFIVAALEDGMAP